MERDVASGIELNDNFHHMLSGGSDNRRLCELLDSLRSEVKRLEIWAFSDVSEWGQSIKEHQAILDAIESREFEDALEILNKNRLNSYTHIKQELRHAELSENPGNGDKNEPFRHGKE